MEGDWSNREFLPPLDGHRTRAFTKDEIVQRWEAKIGRKMTPQELATLEWGCVGIASTLAGVPGHPQYNLVFSDPTTYPRQFKADEKLAPLEQANNNLNQAKKSLRKAEEQLRDAKKGLGRSQRSSPEVSKAKAEVDRLKTLVEKRREQDRAAAAKISLTPEERRSLLAERAAAQGEHSKRSLDLVRDVKRRIEDVIARGPANKEEFIRMKNEDSVLARVRGLEAQFLPAGNPATWDVVTWAKDFYSGQDVARDNLGRVLINPDTGRPWPVATAPNPAAFEPDPVTGQVNMSRDLNFSKAAGMGNFDFNTEVAPGLWADANHMEYRPGDPRRDDPGPMGGPMKVYLSREEDLHSYGGRIFGAYYDSRVYGLSIRSVI
ncbi:PspA/IM30 family protein [Nocardia sp. NBC_00881]|uniref:hypothetical protein n=1 Tax=Nocardia sp. NBC_00881 TaxID=2975995 RepID=UPI0038630253|nr:PspA/IM30 family protein [Nocardia sp. NBC_00881]